MEMMMLFAFLTGVTIVTSRTVNAKLSEYTSPQTSTLMNYITGLIISLLLMFIMKEKLPKLSEIISLPPYLYLGGALGVSTIFIANIITHKLSAFKLTLLMFIAQLFAGLVIDYFIYHIFSPGKLVGGVFILIGLIFNHEPNTKADTK